MTSCGRPTASLAGQLIFFSATVIAVVSTICPSAEATILRFTTSVGAVDVRMFDTATPASVANFMNYVEDDDFVNSFFHRMPWAQDDHGDTGRFVLQGGGYKYTTSAGFTTVPTDAPVVNEPGLSNRKYSLAYAKLGGDPNSATSGFFFNLQDNANNLNNQNGGFTVFGWVVGGFSVVDTIASYTAYNIDGAGSTFDWVPLRPNATTYENGLVFVLDVAELDIPAGDYNFDGKVDLADYSIWRDSLGSTTDVRADGNGDGVVNAADYGVWKSSFGQLDPGTVLASTQIPEPGAIATIVVLGSIAGLLYGAKKAGLE